MLFLSAGFSESDGILIDQLLKFRHRHCHTVGGILNADQYWAKETAAWEAKWPQMIIDGGLQ